jgi:hypothetical protein
MLNQPSLSGSARRVAAVILATSSIAGCGHQVVQIDFNVNARLSGDASVSNDANARELSIQSVGADRWIHGGDWRWLIRPSIVGFGGEFHNEGTHTICIQFQSGNIAATSKRPDHPWPTTGALYLEGGRWEQQGKSHGYGSIVQLAERCVAPGRKLAHAVYFDTKKLSGEDTLFGARDQLEKSIAGRTASLSIPILANGKTQWVRVDFTAIGARMETAYW